jgi:hypothetical protein
MTYNEKLEFTDWNIICGKDSRLKVMSELCDRNSILKSFFISRIFDRLTDKINNTQHNLLYDITGRTSSLWWLVGFVLEYFPRVGCV